MLKEYIRCVLEPLEVKLSAEIAVYRGNELLYPASFSVAPRWVDKITVDEEANCVFFPFHAGTVRLVGVLLGAGAGAESVAVLLTALLERRSKKSMDREEMLKTLLLGNAELSILIELETVLTGSFQVFAVSCLNKKSSAVVDFLLQFGEGCDHVVPTEIAGQEQVVAFLKKMDNCEDYHSAREFADMLYASANEELGMELHVGIGGAGRADQLASMYGQAVSALKLGQLSELSGNVYPYKDLCALKILEDIPTEKLNGYFEVLADKNTLDMLNDAELVDTARSFLANSLNISETARNMFIHRNTLIYRLDKIENASGLNIRSFSDAFTFRILLTLHRRMRN